MSCIGTAGHVDHGKSTLVKALTGIDPDRLAEEKERGMTIDLGFAWLHLPSGREVSIVDVPGHESFIKNMLAGVGGIDAALLVIAADEGIMPQTREHLAILDLLAVPRGVVALTKADLVDEEWLELVQEEVLSTLQGTTLAGSAIIPVSAYTGQGLPALLNALDQVLDVGSDRKNIARPRLPIDRVFSLTGFGTIVTGTLLDGNFKVGQDVEILPQGMKTRIRGLQTHQQQIEAAQPGSRVAMNVTNVARSDIERGNVVALPGQLRTTLLVDARIHLLAAAERPLAHNTQVDFYSGSQEIAARVRLLDLEELQPGKRAWAQLRLSEPAVVARHDHFILRIPSPSMTIGGGEIIDVLPRYHRRHQRTVLDALERLAQASPEELVLSALDSKRAVRSPAKGAAATQAKSAHSGHTVPASSLEDIAKQCNLAQDVTQQILETLLSEERVRKLGSLWCAEHVWEALADEAVGIVQAYHEQYPLRSGISKEEWRARLGLPVKMITDVFAALQIEARLEAVEVASGDTQTLLEASTRSGGLIRVPGFAPDFTSAQRKQVARLLQLFQDHPYAPPVRSEAQEIADPEIVNALIEQGRLVKIGDSVLFLRETYEEAIGRLIAYLREHEKITVSEARDVLGTSRKYVLPLLERMDTLHVTRRLGDERVLGASAEKVQRAADA